MEGIVLKGKIIIRGKIRVETGLHIGGSKTGIDIGGVDNTVIKDPEGKPYIPGSSLKGKMRSLLEKAEGLAVDSKRVWQKLPQGDTPGISLHMCDEENCVVCNIFGRNNATLKKVKKENNSKSEDLTIKNTTPTRLIVRDAKLIESSISLKMKSNIEFEWTEVKFENSIDRITSAANPRQQERVPREAEFEMEMVYNVYTDDDIKRFKKVLEAMRLLEDDYLGGDGSRGYGKISFQNIEIIWRPREYYEQNEQKLEVLLNEKLKEMKAEEICNKLCEILKKGNVNEV